MIEGILVGVFLTLMVAGTIISFKNFTDKTADKWDGYWCGMFIITWWNIVGSVLFKVF